MKQISLRTKQSYGSIFGVDQAWQNNRSKKLTIQKPTLAACRRHTIGLKSDGMVTAVGDNEYDQCDVNSWWASNYPVIGLKY